MSELKKQLSASLSAAFDAATALYPNEDLRFRVDMARAEVDRSVKELLTQLTKVLGWNRAQVYSTKGEKR